MSKWIKRIAAAVLSLAVLGTALLYFGAYLGDRKAARRIDVQVSAVPIPGGPDALERGRYLYASRGCADCHGANGGGKPFMDGGAGGLYAKAPNISTGAGNVVASYRAEDWVRIIRHGVKPNGSPAFIMPSEDYNRLTDADLGALVAYIRQLPPAEGEGVVLRIPAMVKALYGAGMVLDAAEKIDHTLAPSTEAPQDGSARHGAYVASMCIGCHGAQLAGGKIPGAPPDWPPAADLRPGEGGGMNRYADAGPFIAMLRSGKRPDGSAVSAVMPFGSLRELSDADAGALHTYLKQLAPAEAAKR